MYNNNINKTSTSTKEKLMWFFLAFMIIAVNIDTIMDIFGL